MKPLFYTGIIQALFIALFMLCKQPNRLSDKVVALWMLFMACPMLLRLGSMNYPDAFFSDLYSIRSFSLTFGPFLWLYTNVLIGKKQSMTRSELWHFLPFLVFAFWQLLFPEYFVLPSIHAAPPSPLQKAHGVATLFSLLGYSGMVLWRLNRHSRQVLDHFSCLSTSITLQWLKWLSIGFVIAYLLPILAPLLSLPPIFHKHGMAFTGYIFILSFFALKQPIIFHPSNKEAVNVNLAKQQTTQEPQQHIQQSREEDIPSMPSSDDAVANIEVKYERSGLTAERAQEYVQRLEDAMLQQRYYLEADLTIEKLAKLLHISRHHLTQVLNEHYGKNFYVYINEYRIKNVQQRLLDPDNANLTILAIAYESGFNSKSTFNTVFKKITAMTPSQYRKTQVQT